MYTPPDASVAREAPASPARAGTPIELGRLVVALRARWRAPLVVALVFGVVGIAVARFVVRQTWAAETMLSWEPPPGVTLDATAEAHAIETAVASVELSANLSELRRRLALTSTLAELGARVEVAHEEDTRLVAIRGLGPTREEAEELAGAIVQVFLDHELAMVEARLDDALSDADDEIAAAERARDDARRVAEGFRAEHGIADLDAEISLGVATAADLHARALVARADADAEGARLDALSDAERRAPRASVLTEVSVDPGAERLGDALAELASVRSRLADAHPTVRALEEEARSLTAREGTELVTGRTRGVNPEWAAIREDLVGARTEHEAAVHRETSLLALSDSERGRVEQLTAVAARLAELETAANAAEERVTVARAARQALETERAAARPGFRVVSPATSPEWPRSSHRRAVALAAPILGVLLGLLAILVRAILPLRAHTAAEATFWSTFPTLASSAWPRDPRALLGTVTELRETLSKREGEVLVVDETGELAPDLGRALERRFRAAGRRVRRASMSLLPAAELRRRVRAAGDVIVVVEAGQVGVGTLSSLAARLGRERGIGLVLAGVSSALSALPDRCGALDRNVSPTASARRAEEVPS